MKLKTIAVLAIPLLTSACHYCATEPIMYAIDVRTAIDWSAAFWLLNVVAGILAITFAVTEE